MKIKALRDLTYEEFFKHPRRHDIPADGKTRIIGRDIEDKLNDIETYVALEELTEIDEEKEKYRMFNEIAMQVSRKHAQLIHTVDGSFIFIPIEDAPSFYGSEHNPRETLITNRTQISAGSVIVLGENYRLKLETIDLESERNKRTKSEKRLRSSDTASVDLSEIFSQDYLSNAAQR